MGKKRASKITFVMLAIQYVFDNFEEVEKLKFFKQNFKNFALNFKKSLDDGLTKYYSAFEKVTESEKDPNPKKYWFEIANGLEILENWFGIFEKINDLPSDKVVELNDELVTLFKKYGIKTGKDED